MIRFRHLSIGRRLMLSLLVAAVLALALASAVFVLFERLTLQQRAESVIEPYAKLISVGAEGAVAFADAAPHRKSWRRFTRIPKCWRQESSSLTGDPLRNSALEATAPCPAIRSAPTVSASICRKTRPSSCAACRTVRNCTSC